MLKGEVLYLFLFLYEVNPMLVSKYHVFGFKFTYLTT